MNLKDVMKAALGLGGLGCPEKQRMYNDLNEERKIGPWRRVQGQKRSTLLLAHVSLDLINIAQVPQMSGYFLKGLKELNSEFEARPLEVRPQSCVCWLGRNSSTALSQVK